MNFMSYSQLIEDVKEWAKELPKDFDLILGVPRSGMLPATLLALMFNVHLGTIEEFSKTGGVFETGLRLQFNPLGREIKKVLVVEDAVRNGGGIRKAKELFKDKLSLDIKYSSVYITPGSEDKVDYFYKKVDFPRCFEWNCMHGIISESCVDIDGVLCRDPTDAENDDGPKYRDFMTNVKPILLPSRKIINLVTCRLEKYRKLTEEWLEKHNIRYERLTMMDYPDGRSRARDGKHAEFKSEVYKDPDFKLFIESNELQAKKIAKLTNKPVLCVDNMKMY